MSSSLKQAEALLYKMYLLHRRSPSKTFSELLIPLILTISIVIIGAKSEDFWALFIFLPIAYISQVRSLTADVVYEKSEKYKEFLKLNGMKESSYVLAWLLFSYLKVLLIDVMMCTAVMFSGSRLATSSQLLDIFIVMLFYGIAITHLSLIFTTFFSNAKLCSDLAGFLYVLVPFLSYSAISQDNKYLTLLSFVVPQVALLDTFYNEIYRIGTAHHNGFIVLFMDCLIYLAIYLSANQISGIYTLGRRKVSNAIKKQQINIMSEVPQIPNFAPLVEENLAIPIDTIIHLQSKVQDGDLNSALYSEPFENHANLSKVIRVHRLSKTFGRLKVLDHVTLTIYEKQIFCLLGHNGAGKTTSINILTGLLKPDSGDIFFQGQEFSSNADEIKKSLGLCHQNNILFEDMTVYENLELIAKIRGVPENDLMKEVLTILAKLELENDRHKLCKEISGGAKRKVNIGMSIIGDVKIVFLDEPTAGVDPSSRRKIWGLLRDMRDEGKTIVLTTHLLEEADELADRVGVMTQGKLFAVGTSEFIKKKFGIGYRLIITPRYYESEPDQMGEFHEDFADDIVKIVTNKVRDAERLDRNSPNVMSFLLPFSEQEHFAELLKELENIHQIKIDLEMNSLEDAFINIGLEGERFTDNWVETTKASDDIVIQGEMAQSLAHVPYYTFTGQFSALFKKKMICTMKNWTNLVMFVLPLTFFAVSATLVETGDMLELMLTLAYSVNATVYCALPVYEREKQITHLLKVSGCSRIAYWLSTFCFDFLVINVMNLGAIGAIYFGSSFNIHAQYGLFALTLMMFSAALICCGYVWGFFFETSVSVYKYYAPFYFFGLFLFPMSVIAVLTSEKTSPPALLSYFFVCPSANLNYGISLLRNHSSRHKGNLFAVLSNVFLLFLQTVVFMLATLYIDYCQSRIEKSPPSHTNGANLDSSVLDPQDIQSEKNRVLETTDPIKAVDLRKIYPNGTHALRDITFGVEPGQIFGLLGPNGSGKSTTLNIFTRLTPKTSGSAKIRGIEVHEHSRQSFVDAGVCPQFDVYWEQMTVQQHLRFFGELKGMTKKEMRESTGFLMDVLDLREFANKRVSTLSSGTKRKVVAANAIISGSIMMFLDEPTNGIDAISRRKFWDIMSQIVKLRLSAALLTTHSMTEAETLCQKIGILVNGKFVAIGPTQYLKSKYGTGYKVVITKSRCSEIVVEERLTTCLPYAKKTQTNGQSEVYQIGSKGFSLSKVFLVLENMKNHHEIEDFSIYNTTLEQVFIEVSKGQTEDYPTVHSLTDL